MTIEMWCDAHRRPIPLGVEACAEGAWGNGEVACDPQPLRAAVRFWDQPDDTIVTTTVGSLKIQLTRAIEEGLPFTPAEQPQPPIVERKPDHVSLKLLHLALETGDDANTTTLRDAAWYIAHLEDRLRKFGLDER